MGTLQRFFFFFFSCGLLLFTMNCSPYGPGQRSCTSTFDCATGEVCLQESSICIRVVLPDAAYNPGNGGTASNNGSNAPANAGNNGANAPTNAGNSGNVGNNGNGGTNAGTNAGANAGNAGTNSPSCSNVCQDKQTRCNPESTGVEYCVLHQGCYVWSRAALCQNGFVCADNRCVQKTGNGCPQVCQNGEKRCNAEKNGVEYCVEHPTTKCFVWSRPAPCPTGQSCANAACGGGGSGNNGGNNGSNGNCQNVCTEFLRRCVGGKQQTCKKQANGCTDWGDLLSCPSGQSCQGDKCVLVSNCQNKCAANATRCSGQNIQSCLKQTDGCLNWQNSQTCTSSQVCDASGGSASCKQQPSGNNSGGNNSGGNNSGGNNSGGNSGSGDNCGMNAEEAEVFRLTNVERGKQGRPPLKCNAKLVQAARSWSVEQCKAGRISHDRFSQRVRATGLPLRGSGENVAAGQPSPASVINSWMNSSGHRANILRGSFNFLGVGYHRCTSSRYGHYWTQIFGTM